MNLPAEVKAKGEQLTQLEQTIERLHKDRSNAISQERNATQRNMMTEAKNHQQTVKQLDKRITKIQGHLEIVKGQLYALEDTLTGLQMVEQLSTGTESLNELNKQVDQSEIAKTIKDAHDLVQAVIETNKFIETHASQYDYDNNDELLADLEDEDINFMSTADLLDSISLSPTNTDSNTRAIRNKNIRNRSEETSNIKTSEKNTLAASSSKITSSDLETYRTYTSNIVHRKKKYK